ncbi:MAG: hypothetical protein NTW05_03590 [Pseudonocardiales bacterium]|jgi:hypothetical protein|nr:hypothetical protein [Pseudonocardiales bacterium]
MLRLSEEEFALVRDRAESAGMAVGAWVAELALGACRGGVRAGGVPDLVRLHADVVAAGRLEPDGEQSARVAELLDRLDDAIDAAITASGTAAGGAP